MYGDTLKFVVTGLGVEKMTPEGFDAVMERIPAAAKRLAAAGAQAIELTGTSLTFYKGEAYNQRLRAIVDEGVRFTRHDDEQWGHRRAERGRGEEGGGRHRVQRRGQRPAARILEGARARRPQS